MHRMHGIRGGAQPRREAQGAEDGSNLTDSTAGLQYMKKPGLVWNDARVCIFGMTSLPLFSIPARRRQAEKGQTV